MGILIAPIQLGAAMICVICLLRLLRWLIVKDIRPIILLYGSLISFTLYGLVLMSYWMAGSIYVLDPYFRLTFVLFYAPFVFGLIFRTSDRKRPIFIRKVSYTSILLSGIIASLFYQQFFDVNAFLNLEIYR